MARILITGTSSGIGLATALELGKAGHKVYATMRNPARAPELGRRASAEGLPISILTMDVDSDQSVSDCFASVYRQEAHIDVLVNNAGVERHGSVEELPVEAFRATMETNYFGALRAIRQVLPRMRERGSGCIVNVTSVAGKISSSPLGAYAASKFALEAVSEALAQEMKPFGVRVASPESSTRRWRTPSTMRLHRGTGRGGTWPHCSRRLSSMGRRRPPSPRSLETSSKAAPGNCGIPPARMPRHFWPGEPR
jgi:NAD(P)-dependent dehydrogenase (short-subunit alcohol dehydrogenase family)